MDMAYLLPIVIPITVIVPLLIFAMLFKAAKKRASREFYIKEMAMTTLMSSFYIFFICIFYL